MLSNLLAVISDTTIEKIVEPVVEVCEAVLPVAISIVGVVGLLYCIVLGVRYARANDPQEHEKAKSGLKNAIIGFVLIFVLMIACKIATGKFSTWWETYNSQTFSYIEALLF